MAERPKIRVIEGGGQDLTEEDGKPILVTLLRQPVLGRETQSVVREGVPVSKLKRNGYVRTKEPVDRRQERLLHVSASRVSVTWGDGAGGPVAMYEFGLRSGRMVGNADWLIEKTSLKRLRALAREMFPRDDEEAPEEAQVGEDTSPLDHAEEPPPETA